MASSLLASRHDVPAGSRAERPLRIIPGEWFIAGLSLSVLIVAIMLVREQLHIQVETTSTAIYGGLALLGGSLRYAFHDPRSQRQRIVRDGAEYIGLLMLMCLLGAVASYPVAAVSAGFADSSLERIDHLLHFNWIGWYDVVSAHPALQMLGSAAYVSIYVTPAILLGYFACVGRRAEARLFLAAFWLSAVLTLVLFLCFPAEGPLAFLWTGRIPYMPMSALYQAQLIPALRAHSIHEICLGTMHGLVCAPSFHTTSAVLYIAAAWRVPKLRWPLIALNCAMLLATPVEGTHYLADMICGALLAVIATILVTVAAQRLPVRAA